MTTQQPLTTEQRREAIRQRVVEAEGRQGEIGYRCLDCGITHLDKRFPIRLADMLLAFPLGVVSIWPVDGGELFMIFDKKSSYWNLRRDSLNDQSPETTDFLYDLLLPTQQ